MSSVDNTLQSIAQITPEQLANMTPAQKTELQAKVKDSLQFLKTVSEDSSLQDKAGMKVIQQAVKDLQKMDTILTNILADHAAAYKEAKSGSGELSGLFAAMAALIEVANLLRETADLGLAAGIELIETMADKQKSAVKEIANAEVFSAWMSFGVNAGLQGLSLAGSAKGLSDASSAYKTKMDAAELRLQKTNPDYGPDTDIDVSAAQQSKNKRTEGDEGEEGVTTTRRTTTDGPDVTTDGTRKRADATADKSTEQAQNLQDTDTKSKKRNAEAEEKTRQDRIDEKRKAEQRNHDLEAEAIKLDRAAGIKQNDAEMWRTGSDVLRGMSQSSAQVSGAYVNLEVKTDAEETRIDAEKDMKILDNFNQSLRSSADSAKSLSDQGLSTLQTAVSVTHESRSKIM